MLVSILIPAYKEEKNIKRAILFLEKYLTKKGLKFEVIIVCDGIIDQTFKIAKEYARGCFKVFAYRDNQGKGHALRFAFKKSQGDVIVFFDAGLDFPLQDICRFIDYYKRTKLPVIIGSKRHPLSRVEYPVRRQIVSLLGQKLTKILFGLNVKDMQVGLKLFRRDVLETVFPRMVVKRYAFDIELLALINHYGFRIAEAPINLRLNLVSSSVGFGAVRQTLWDTLAVFYRLNILRFYDRPAEVRSKLLAKQSKKNRTKRQLTRKLSRKYANNYE